MEKTRDSGWHPADLGALEREQKGELFLSERPIVILDDDEMYVVGECLPVFRKVLGDFVAKVETEKVRFAQDQIEKPDHPGVEEKDFIGNGNRFQDRVLKTVKRLLRQEGEVFTIPSREWGSVAAAVMVVGVQCCMTGTHGN